MSISNQQSKYDNELPPAILEDKETGEQREEECEHKWISKGDDFYRCSRCDKWSNE